MDVCVHVTCVCVCVCICVCVCDMFVCVCICATVMFTQHFVSKFVISNQITRVKGNHVTSDSDIDAPRSAEEENKTIKGPMPVTAACFCAFLLASQISF